MRIDDYIKCYIREGWSKKEELLLDRCASELGDQLWNNDPMYGRCRSREEHEAKVAKLGFLLARCLTPEEFIEEIRKIPTLHDRYATAR